MQRLNPEDAARLQGMDMEAEKASARLNMILNVAAFIVIVGVIRVGKFTMTCHGYTVMDLNLRVLAAITELVKRNKYSCVLISSVQGRLLGDISPALCRDTSIRDKYTMLVFVILYVLDNQFTSVFITELLNVPLYIYHKQDCNDKSHTLQKHVRVYIYI